MKDSDTGNAGSLPYQLGIFHILSLYFSYLCLLSLASVKDSDTGNTGSLPYQLGILHILSFYFSYLCLLSLASMKDSDTGNAGSLPYQLGILHILSIYFSYLCLLSLASVKDSDTGNAGSLPYQLGILHILSFYFSYLCLLSLASVKDSDTGNAGSLPYQLGILHILSHSGKGPCIRHTKVQWKVGTRYINPIQPYSFSRQLYLSYQDRICTIIQLGIVRVVIWFPCWCPVGLRAGILMPRFCSSIPQHLGPLVWAPRPLVTSKTRRSLVTTVLSRQGQPTQLGGRHFSSWQPVAVLPMQAGLPLCQCHLDPLQLSHLCLNLWEV